MSGPVIVLSPAELQALIRDAVRAEMGTAKADEREVLTRDQAAALLEVHPSVLVRYVRNDGLQGYKVGQEWRFKRSEILAWLEAHAVKPGAHVARAGRKIRNVKGAA